MSPVERLTAAIEKLEGLRDTATVGPWETTPDGDVWAHPVDPNTGGRVTHLDNIAACPHLNDAWLIEVLHRTIDAQLAILEDGLRWERIIGDRRSQADEYVIALADAILGEAS